MLIAGIIILNILFVKKNINICIQKWITIFQKDIDLFVDII